jgi:hypothetical protein
MMVAARIMHLARLSRTNPHLLSTLHFDDMQCKALYCFRHMTRTPPDDPPSMQDVMRGIARLGGYLGRTVG